MSNGPLTDLMTPDEHYAALDREFHFTLDAAATARSAKCPRFYSPEDNGLEHPWEGETVFCHPPGDDIARWVRKCHDEGKKPGTTVVLWVPAKTDAAYFHNHILDHAEIRYLKGRIVLSDIHGHLAGRPACGTLVAVYRGRSGGTLQDHVYQAIGAGTMTAAEIAAILFERGIHVSNNSVAARLCDLQRRGLVRRAGQQLCGVNHHTITAWERV